MAKAARKKHTGSGTERQGHFVIQKRADMASKVDEPLSKVGRVKTTGTFVPISRTRFEAVLKAAELSGLLGDKSTRIGGRISPVLIEKAKKQTGIETDTDLIEFALANVALDDNFGETFRKTRGTVDPSLKLGF
ncbi:hypothetical protein [Mesorhizobium sp.]|uniref:hypothetical protein n=1 Tax=Mesorhizobium sp. TaxID=1871066 RepID=UPI0025C30050|nr:hypothetical protein [Mesorhizobium sp.]